MNRLSDSNEITRKYLDSILIKERLIDSDLPDTSIELFGRSFSTPICTAALSHMSKTCPGGMSELAEGAKLANAVNFCGMEEYEGELDEIAKVKAATIRIIKPHANNDDVFKRIEHAKELGVFGLGMDIDHAFNACGGYDTVEGLPMRPKTSQELESFVKAAGELPFVIKGVLSVEDALKCVEIGAKGIVVSHHHGIMPYAIPPLYILPEIKAAVKDKLTIFVDCNIESGADVYKALCLGADAVCLGRALIEPLGKNNSLGVSEKIKAINDELSSLMARTGYHTLSELNSDCLVRFEHSII